MKKYKVVSTYKTVGSIKSILNDIGILTREEFLVTINFTLVGFLLEILTYHH